METTVIYLTNRGTFGYRKKHFNWKAGDHINTPDGEPCTIIKTVASTPENLKFLSQMVDKIKTYDRGKEAKQTVEFMGFKARQTVGVYTWKSPDARKEFINNNLNKLQSWNS